jgi:hypothetical protein
MGIVKMPLVTLLKSNLSIVFTFLRIFAPPLQSALTNQLSAVRYKPRLIRFPEDCHPSGFSPYLGSSSLSKKEAFEV